MDVLKIAQNPLRLQTSEVLRALRAKKVPQPGEGDGGPQAKGPPPTPLRC